MKPHWLSRLRRPRLMLVLRLARAASGREGKDRAGDPAGGLPAGWFWHAAVMHPRSLGLTRVWNACWRGTVKWSVA